ncbi:hypothetical protein EHS25_002412 [Saitozyma podzolica]|uniref:Major facilitator superfamily (MFS) profile domain-containing protein n=1 Tax=Saitozyma podzolica TaxID=1890683 RepID=A0A427YDV0_9TREE|nr:hypothetical protein EHS25_002412 [Saitozyma podzolica]
MPPSQSPLAAGAVPTSSPSSSQSTPLPSTTHLATFEPSIPPSQVSTPDASEKPTSSDLVPTPDASDMPKLKKSISIQDQSTRLPLRRILVIYVGIGIALMVSFIDQTSVSTASPVIGTALDGSDSISWVGTAFFVANCALHLVYGRLSDIFGRKQMLQIAVFFLAFGNLLCGFAKTPVQLYIFRAISGMGGGGINGIAMVIVSDIVPLKDRGKYQGFISAACSTGSAIGPFLGGGLSSAGQWRWVFWVTTILGVICIKLAQIDYLGIFLSVAGTVLLLVPISGGGSTFAWDSAVVIALLIVGSLCMIGFVLCQWKFARLPILPLRLFKERTTAVVMFQSFFIGMTYYGNIYYVPQYFQYIKGYSSLISGAWVLAYTFPGAFWGIASGFYISKTNHYKRVIIIGGILWTLSQGLQILWGPDTNIGEVVGVLQINTIGVGFLLQTTLVAALNTSAAPDRAVVTSGRNFFRTMGGAFGLAIANAVYNNVVSSQLQLLPFTDAQRTALLTSALDTLETLSSSEKRMATEVLADGLRKVYIMFTVIAGTTLVCAFFIQEVVFRRDSPELEAERRRAKGLPEKDAEEGQGQTTPSGGEITEGGPLPAEGPADLVGGELIENHLDEKDEDKKERQRDRLMSVEEVVGDDEKVNVERRDSPASVSPTSTLAGVPLETEEVGREHSIKKAE